MSSFVLRLLLGIITRFEVQGLENVPLGRPVLLVANHVHFADPPIIGSVLGRKVAFMAKAEVFSKFPLRLIARGWGAFSVRRGQGDTGAIRQSIKVIEQGMALGIFPEGHRSKDGKLQPAHLGAAMIALRSGATILPIGISGTHTFLRWPNVLQRPRVVVSVGKPFQPAPDASQSVRQQQVALTNEIMLRIADLVPAEQRGIYGQLGPDGRPVAPTIVETATRSVRIANKPRRMTS